MHGRSDWHVLMEFMPVAQGHKAIRPITAARSYWSVLVLNEV